MLMFACFCWHSSAVVADKARCPLRWRLALRRSRRSPLLSDGRKDALVCCMISHDSLRCVCVFLYIGTGMSVSGVCACLYMCELVCAHMQLSLFCINPRWSRSLPPSENIIQVVMKRKTDSYTNHHSLVIINGTWQSAMYYVLHTNQRSTKGQQV